MGEKLESLGGLKKEAELKKELKRRRRKLKRW